MQLCKAAIIQEALETICAADLEDIEEGGVHIYHEITTAWSFPDRGDWAMHVGNYRGKYIKN